MRTPQSSPVLIIICHLICMTAKILDHDRAFFVISDIAILKRIIHMAKFILYFRENIFTLAENI